MLSIFVLNFLMLSATASAHHYLVNKLLKVRVVSKVPGAFLDLLKGRLQL